jgi:hypothetical protein
MPAAKRGTTRRRTAAKQPKRILNVKPSPKEEEEEDWTYEPCPIPATTAVGC